MYGDSNITNIVNVLTTNVSKCIPNTCISPCSTSLVDDEALDAIAPVPSPASVENIDFVVPTIKPVKKLLGLKALLIINLIIFPNLLIFPNIINKQVQIYKIAINGTNLDTTLAISFTPLNIIRDVITTTTIPITNPLTGTISVTILLIVFDCIVRNPNI